MVCLFQRKEEKLQPYYATFLKMAWTFYYFLFPPVPVKLAYYNVLVLVYRMRLTGSLQTRTSR